MTKNKELNSEKPQNHSHYICKNLKFLERMTIALVYSKTWKRLVTSSKLNKNEKAYFELYLKEVHARYYLRVVKGPNYIKSSRLVLNFLLSKANENLRAILLSLNPYNLTVFVQAIRSQIELNALVHKFAQDADYHQKLLTLNEDRSRVNDLETVININTLVEKLDKKPLPYSQSYKELSLLLHPNPSAIKFYAQAEGESTADGTGIFKPIIKYYFDETVSSTKRYDDWFNQKIWFFLTITEHFIFLIDELKNDFFINKMEEEQFTTFAWAQIIKTNESQILEAANNAVKNGEDVSIRVQEAIDRIFSQELQSKNGN